MNIINNTQHNAAPFILMDKTGAENLLVVFKGTWDIGKDGKLTIDEEQMPIISEPVYSGEPGKTSLICDTDVIMEKPGTDCVLLGHAYAPAPRLPFVDVTFAVGPVKKQLRVFGERRWSKNRVGMSSILKMSPVEKVALTWENAFGGSDTSWQDPAKHEFCLENPVGMGFMAAKTNVNFDGQLLPYIENPADLIEKPGQHPKPAGFAMVAPYWQPRAGFAGTYDENWRNNINPLPPEDFDRRFNSCAAPGLCTPDYLTGTEQVLVDGACKQGPLRFDLPGITPQVSVRFRQRKDDVAMRLDTVVVEPDEARLVMVWRGILNIHGSAQEIMSVSVNNLKGR